MRLLKMIPLVNSRFFLVAPNYLFEGLYLTFIPMYLDKITEVEVSLHHTLRLHVRTIESCCEILSENFAEFEILNAEIHTGDPRYLTGGEPPPEAYVPGARAVFASNAGPFYATFCRLLISQKACSDGQMDLALLSAVLAMLPNLEATRIAEFQSYRICRGTQSCPVLSLTFPHQSNPGLRDRWPHCSLVLGSLVSSPWKQVR